MGSLIWERTMCAYLEARTGFRPFLLRGKERSIQGMTMTDNPKTILVVDDEDSVRNLAAMVLEEGGYQVLKARHSDEALIMLDSYKDTVHLLLTDVKMDPFLTGCELAKCIRLLRPDIVVLYVSGFASHPMVQQEVEEGRATFLAKPFSAKDLLSKVRESLVAAARPA